VKTFLIVLIVVVAVAVIATLAIQASRRRRSTTLQRRFGPEYEHRIEEHGDRKAAEAELRDVARRRKQLEIRPLSAGARDRYSEEWRQVQSRFVDQPDQAVGDADRLVALVMRERGYPVEDFDDQIDMVAVDHPGVVENYRAAHAIHQRNAQRMANTDDLRQALIHYRSLFDELLSDGVPERDAVRDRPAPSRP
jgi:FtsZ-interacting cell division protein ZipA